MKYLALLLGLVAACGGEPTGATAQAIVGGSASTTHDYVVQVETPSPVGGTEWCAGTLIAPNVVLTARHCVSPLLGRRYQCTAAGEVIEDGAGGGQFTPDPDPSTIKVTFGRDLMATAPVADVGVAIVHDKARHICGHDLAAIVLKNGFPGAPLAPLRLAQSPTAGEKLAVVGWGRTDKELMASVRQVREGVEVLVVGPLVARPDAQGSIVPRTFQTGPSACLGDSGGAAISSAGSLVGVTSAAFNLDFSSTDNPCATSELRAVYTQIAGHAAVVRDALDKASARGWLEGKSAPGWLADGEKCTADEECGSRKCNQCCGACPAPAPDPTPPSVTPPPARPSGGCNASPSTSASPLLLLALVLVLRRYRGESS
jgi:uncharacterized protein (TIGR03382 family)